MVGIKKGLICDQCKKTRMISDFYSIFKSPLKISAKKIKIAEISTSVIFEVEGQNFRWPPNPEFWS